MIIMLLLKDKSCRFQKNAEKNAEKNAVLLVFAEVGADRAGNKPRKILKR